MKIRFWVLCHPTKSTQALVRVYISVKNSNNAAGNDPLLRSNLLQFQVFAFCRTNPSVVKLLLVEKKGCPKMPGVQHWLTFFMRFLNALLLFISRQFTLFIFTSTFLDLLLFEEGLLLFFLLFKIVFVLFEHPPLPAKVALINCPLVTFGVFTFRQKKYTELGRHQCPRLQILLRMKLVIFAL